MSDKTLAEYREYQSQGGELGYWAWFDWHLHDLADDDPTPENNWRWRDGVLQVRIGGEYQPKHCPVCDEPMTRTGSLSGQPVCGVHCSKCGHDRQFEDYLDFCSVCDRDGGPCAHRPLTEEELAMRDHAVRLHTDPISEKIEVRCPCGWELALGYTPTPAEAMYATEQHRLWMARLLDDPSVTDEPC